MGFVSCVVRWGNVGALRPTRYLDASDGRSWATRARAVSSRVAPVVPLRGCERPFDGVVSMGNCLSMDFASGFSGADGRGIECPKRGDTMNSLVWFGPRTERGSSL